MLKLLEPSDGKTVRRLEVGDPPLLAKNVQRREAASEYKVGQSGPRLWAWEFWRRRPSSLGCNCVLARRRSLRFGAAAVLLLHRRRQASIAGIAEKEQRLRRIDFGGAGRALAATGAVLHPRSFLDRPIWRSRFRGSALAGATKSDLGNHQWPSTNSLSSSAVIPLWRVCNLATAAGKA